MKNLTRRDFLKNGTVATLGSSVLPSSFLVTGLKNPVRIGVIGTGGRGTSLIRNLLNISGVEISAVCDLFQDRAENAAAICRKAGRKAPKIYCKDTNTYRDMLNKEKLDGVLIATYWEYHAPMALKAMNEGIHTGVEVPAALTIEDLWKLVETTEKTGVPCMMLENWSFRKDNLALLNMKRTGMFGEIVHCHCAHSHNCIDHWFFDQRTGVQKWPAKYLLKYNRDQYPTHSLGPILSWMDINCGDVFSEIYSTATASKGINFYFREKFGKDHPNANLEYRQGDLVTSVLKTKKGKTVIINNYDMQLERPYANRWTLQGLKGVYMEEKKAIYLAGESPEYERWEEFKPYEERFDHKWWRQKSKGDSHGGVDFVMLTQFIESIKNKKPLPLTIYDSAVMSAVVELSGMSIEKNAPVPFPDFTKGKWTTSEPYFALDR